MIRPKGVLILLRSIRSLICHTSSFCYKTYLNYLDADLCRFSLHTCYLILLCTSLFLVVKIILFVHACCTGMYRITTSLQCKEL